MLKPTLSLTEQIALLRSRGLQFKDETGAKKVLSEYNYYRLNYYFHCYYNALNRFPEGTDFSDIFCVCQNDIWFRGEIRNVLELIEIRLRTEIAYHLGMEHGSAVFYEQNCFSDYQIFMDLNSAFQKEVQRNRNDACIRHHIKCYEGRFPIWVVVEYLSFSSISKLFGNLIVSDKRYIARNRYGFDERLVSNWFHVLSVLRNISAHYGPLYQRSFLVRPMIPKAVQTLHRIDNSALFSQIMLIAWLLQPDQKANFIDSICQRSNEVFSFKLSDYGFPSNWEHIIQE